MTRPSTAAEYLPDWSRRVEATCLYVASKLGDLMDEIVIVGGYAPQLMIPQDAIEDAANRHVGTADLDLGLGIGILNQERYKEISERLRAVGFEPDHNKDGNLTRQRWVVNVGAEEVRVDFLIEPADEDARGGEIQNLEGDFAAVVVPGLHLAFRDRMPFVLEGKTIHGERATRRVQVCGPGAFTVLKTLAFSQRGENKDAYDLFYVASQYGDGPADVARHLREISDDPLTEKVVETHRSDFGTHDSLGQMRVAEFLGDRTDEAIRADVVGTMKLLVMEYRG